MGKLFKVKVTNTLIVYADDAEDAERKTKEECLEQAADNKHEWVVKANKRPLNVEEIKSLGYSLTDIPYGCENNTQIKYLR